MRNSDDIHNRLGSRSWSEKIAGKVVRKHREKQRRNRVLLSVSMLFLIAFPIVLDSIYNHSGWDYYLSTWLQQEESVYDLTQEDYANIVGY